LSEASIVEDEYNEWLLKEGMIIEKDSGKKI